NHSDFSIRIVLRKVIHQSSDWCLREGREYHQLFFCCHCEWCIKRRTKK
ncbi:hypothetical protein D049_1102B, partial [Vibrio parahaemolyticus VPTS-2010]